ncbi:DUF808 domain-containing protein, partial [Pseudomonas syringae]
VIGRPVAHSGGEGVTEAAGGAVGGLSMLVPTLIDAVAGIIAGAVLVVVVTLVGKVWKAAKE